ncbi:retrovirus-related pol polyprotein from transposon TNT 1-94 [Tanacetum coccineum]
MGEVLRTKDETPEVIIKFLKEAQVSLQATVRYLRKDNGTEFINQTLRLYRDNVGITHQTLVARTPQQNGVVKRGLIPNQAASTSTKTPSKNDLDMLFQPIFDEYFKHSPSAISMTVSTVTLLPPNTTRASSYTTIDQDDPSPSTSPTTEITTTPIQSANVEELNNENVKFDSDTFTNPFAPPVPSSAESSSRIVDTSKMHTFQQLETYIRRWTKDHSLLTIIGNPSKLVSTRCQLETDTMWCYFHAFLTKVEHKNYKEAMMKSSWIESMQEEIHELKKALYGLKQAPRAWYDMLSKFILSQKFIKGIINQSKYALEVLKNYGLERSDAVDTLMVERSKLDEDPQGTPVD